MSVSLTKCQTEERRGAGEGGLFVIRAEPSELGDGRTRRSARTRAHLVDAVRAVVASGEEPTPERVAARAGVSERTLFRLFGDLPALWEAVRTQMAADLGRWLEAAPCEGTLRQRVHGLVGRRIAMFERIAPYRRWVDAREALYPAIRQGRETLDRALRTQTAEALAPELAAGGAALSPAIDSLLSYETWGYLRASRSLGPRQLATLLETAVLRLLSPAAKPSYTRLRRKRRV
jgi:AcrR family transcriptional regulator